MEDKLKKAIIFIVLYFIFVSCFSQDIGEITKNDTLKLEKKIILKNPTDFQIKALNDKYLSLNWKDNCKQETGYKIERKEVEKEFSVIATLEANKESYLDKGLIFGVEYTYRIYAFNADTTSAYSDELKAKTIFPKPTGLTYKQLNDTSAIISWKDNSSFEDGFVIERQENDDQFMEIAEASENKKSIIEKDLQCNIDYTYRIKAYNETNESKYSEELHTKLIFAVPSQFKAKPITDSSIRLTWINNADYAEGFILERKIEDTEFQQIAQLSQNKTHYQDEELKIGLNYSYRIKAFTQSNESEYSNIVSTSTTFVAPTDLDVDVLDDNEVKLYWIYRGDIHDGFSLERKTETDTFKVIDRVSHRKRTMNVKGLELGIKYSFRIKAYTDFNESLYSNTVTAVTNFAAPGNLYSEYVDDQAVDLYWEDNSSFEEKFVIERKEPEGDFQPIAKLTANTTYYQDKGLTYGLPYKYRIIAITSFSQSAYSNVLTAETHFPKPTYLSANAVDDQTINLSWTDNCSFDNGFILERKRSTGEFKETATLDAQTNNYIDKKLQFGVQYTYRVLSKTQQNRSNYSKPVVTNTIFPKPTLLNVNVIDDQSVSLSWEDNCGFEKEYVLERKTDDKGYQELIKLPVNSTSYLDKGLKYGKVYNYKVKAKTDINSSNYSKQVEVQTVFPAPTELNVEIVGDAVLGLNWKDNCTFEDGYRIDRATDGKNYNTIKRTSADQIDFKDKNLTYGVTYTYKIYAFTHINNSGPTNTKSELMVVYPPENTDTQIIGDEKIRLVWDDVCKIEEGYKIERKTKDSEFKLLTSLGPNSTYYLDSDVKEHISYFYRIFAYTVKSKSEFSAVLEDVCHFGKLRIPEEYLTIQAAIDAAIDGNSVLIRPGLYKENLNLQGKEVKITSYYFENQDSSLIKRTIIDGDSLGSVMRIESCGENTLISGLTLQNGSGKDDRGGGIFIYNSDPKLEQLKIINNSAVEFGGGIYMVDSNPTLSNVLIANNSSNGNYDGYGGGLYLSDSKPVLMQVKIMNNTAREFGGGLYVYHSDPIIKNTLITNNDVVGNQYGHGGGIYSQYANIALSNVTLAGNNSLNGGAIFCNNDSEVNIINTVLWNNQPQEICYHKFGDIKTTISYSLLDGMEDGILTNNNGTIFMQAGLINNEPQFIDIKKDDFRLQGNSACKDAGNPDEKYNDSDGTRNDIGAYGGKKNRRIEFYRTK